MRAVFFFVSFCFFAGPAFAFPENVRHGYFSCTACHVSPSGGGVLTPYGRSLSAELMSTWGTAKTAGFLFTDNESEKSPAWFRAALLLRGVQTYKNTATLEKAATIPMQADLDAGIDTEKLAVIATAGFRSNGTSKSLTEFFSRRHYLLYRFSDKWSARAGKFLFSFGLNLPDHITATRRGLGWDQGSESYNLEANLQTEKLQTTLTAVSDTPDGRGTTKDKALALTTNYFVGEHSKAGVSLYSGQQTGSRRLVFGPQWVFALTDRLYLESEFFWQRKELTAPATRQQSGYATFHRLGYEIKKGVIPFLQADRSDLDDTDQTQKYSTYGVGLQWLPYSHLELLSFLGKEKIADQDVSDYAWLMVNIYL
jgi:hypothetical protein